MKKVIMGIVLAVVLGGTAAYAQPSGFGIGVLWQQQIGLGNYGVGNSGPSLSLKLPGSPIFWAVNLGIGDNYFGLGIQGDHYLVYRNIAGPVYWYLGLGARLPIGISIQPVNFLEIFVDAAPSLGVRIDFGSGDHSGVRFPVAGVPLGFGIRLWL
ncbi:MAG: hypothetical protein FWD94_08265 [Treponema sp.]|nr:hypothetical protein [Treponema sp.]